MTSSRLALALSAGLHLACSAARPDDAEEPAVVADQAIVHGAIDRGRHPSVVALSIEGADGTHLCSGAVVAPDVVVTARHCVSPLEGPEVACPSRVAQVGRTVAPGAITVYLGDDVRTGALPARGRSVVVPPGDVLCEADLALVTLDRPVAARPLPIGGPAEPKAGGRIVAVGYGQTGSTGSAGVRRFRTDVTILRVTATEFVVDESTCPGDSGGPALDPETGAILGVVSRGSARCDGTGARNVYTRTSAFSDLIARVTGKTAPGASSPPAGDLGDECRDGRTCSTGLCAAPSAPSTNGGGRSGVCSRRCGGDDRRCPNGFRCAKRSGAVDGACVPHL